MVKFALVPAYNESKHIHEVVQKINKLGIKTVVVDDGSADNTYNLAKESDAIVLRHEKNKGKGEALKTGLNYLLKNKPEFTQLVVIDADMQFEPSESKKIFKALDTGADLAVGYRDWSKVPKRHRLGNYVWRTTFNLFFGTDLKDTNCGLIGFNKEAVKKIKDRIMGGYIIENSILVGALKNKLRIKQVQVQVNYHQKSKVLRGIRVVLSVLAYIFKEGITYRLGKLRR